MSDLTRLFILGVGAQKSGTSWLYHYLATAPNAATDGVKEYHIWDTVYLQETSNARVAQKDSGLSLQRKIQYALQQSPDSYFEYFDQFLRRSGKDVSCDITPNYAGLDHRALGAIRHGFAQRGILTRAAFLMRDPVERCWSAARMKGRIHAGSTAVSEEEVLAHADLPGANVRTRYDLTIGQLEQAFDPSDLFLGIYEELFEPGQIARLSAFCNVPERPELADKKVLVSPVAIPLSKDAYRRIARQYRAVYDFAAARFPQTLQLWPGYEYL